MHGLDALGVSPTASDNEIKKAYRKVLYPSEPLNRRSHGLENVEANDICVARPKVPPRQERRRYCCRRQIQRNQPCIRCPLG